MVLKVRLPSRVGLDAAFSRVPGIRPYLKVLNRTIAYSLHACWFAADNGIGEDAITIAEIIVTSGTYRMSPSLLLLNDIPRLLGPLSAIFRLIEARSNGIRSQSSPLALKLIDILRVPGFVGHDLPLLGVAPQRYSIAIALVSRRIVV